MCQNLHGLQEGSSGIVPMQPGAPLHPWSSTGSHGNRLRAAEMRDWQIAAAQGCGLECSGIHPGIPSPILPVGVPHPAPATVIPDRGDLLKKYGY